MSDELLPKINEKTLICKEGKELFTDPKILAEMRNIYDGVSVSLPRKEYIELSQQARRNLKEFIEQAKTKRKELED